MVFTQKLQIFPNFYGASSLIAVCDFRLLPPSEWELCSSGLLCSD